MIIGLSTNFSLAESVSLVVRGIEDAVETLLAVRGIEQIARELAGSPEEVDLAVHHAREVIDAIERFVTYLMGRARPLQSVN